ncbi:MAG: nitrogen regulation protein NR(I) [Sphingomonadales bacterium]
MTQKVVLVADDDAAIRTVVSRALTKADFDVRATGSGAQLWTWVDKGLGDVVITDVVMPDANGLDLVPQINEKRPDLPVIIMSAQNTLDTAIKAQEVGAYEYLPKPFDLGDLRRIVATAMAGRQRADAAAENTVPVNEGLPIIGRSPAMQEVFRIIAKVVGNDLTVMITGESGTGKELVARAIHEMGRRSRCKFVGLNMAAIPKDLIESELFGHERGAFTGAHTRTQGKFAIAQGGTLFLDEIGDMPLEAQTRLLRVLQEGEFVPVGAASSIKTDVRVIAATHQNLPSMVAAKQFREDLYFRLNVIPMHLPPLRERLEDIPDLFHHFLYKMEEDGMPRKSFGSDAVERLMSHHWPGNIRELQNLIRRIVALYPEEVITSGMVESALSNARGGRGGDIETIGAVADESLAMAVDRIISRYFKAHGDQLPPDGLYSRIVREIERPLLTRTLNACSGNQLKAAKLLGLNRNTLRKKLQDHDMMPTRGSRA